MTYHKNIFNLFTCILFMTIFDGNYGQQVKESSDISLPLKCDQHACPIGTNNKSCSGHGQCNCTQESSCLCEKEWVGVACQYELRELTCENLRPCVQCQVHGTGPLSDDDDCEVFCKEYPHPFVMKKLILSKQEVFCSFIDSSNSTDCRFFFKLGNLDPSSLAIQRFERHNPDYTDKYSNNKGNLDVYVIAKRDKDCKLDRTFRSKDAFSQLGIITERNEFSNNDGMEYLLYDKENGSENRQNNYTTLMILFIFIALPFVTCMLSCFANISSLPCGLCNVFRRPSSTYLRNLRPYPGVIILSSPSEV